MREGGCRAGACPGRGSKADARRHREDGGACREGWKARVLAREGDRAGVGWL